MQVREGGDSFGRAGLVKVARRYQERSLNMGKEFIMEKRKMRLTKGISIAVLALVAVAFVLNGWARDQQGVKDGVLVTVNDTKITKAEVDEKIAAMLGPQAAALPPGKLAEIRGQLNQRVLDSMIIEVLLAKAVEKERVTVKDEEIDKVLTQLKESLPPDVKFEEYLKDIGLSEKDLRQTVNKNLKIQKLFEQRMTGVAAPSDKEIETYYASHQDKFQIPERIEVRHILIAVKPDDNEETKAAKMKKAEKIRDEIVGKKGKDFETLATEVSDCPSKAKGGELGLLSRGQAVKPFEDAAFSRKVGEIGPVVKTQFGYHIIEVLDHREAGKIPLSEATKRISNQLVEQKKEKVAKAYIDSLKASATIVIHNEASDGKNPA